MKRLLTLLSLLLNLSLSSTGHIPHPSTSSTSANLTMLEDLSTMTPKVLIKPDEGCTVMCSFETSSYVLTLENDLKLAMSLSRIPDFITFS